MLPSTSLVAVVILMMVAVWTTPIYGSTSRKLDDSTVSGTPDTGIKCTPCEQHSPPLPPPPPPPPASSNTQNCPPPPSVKSPPAPLYYITGPPGNLYPFDPYYSSSSRNSVAGLPVVLVGFGLVLGLLAL
ncbi:leucine-rich repeat extensin-like protein 2 [Macadamia integrifolia]|uniref:leucine-rich repeat extensin-like protein 2 n=1 Tax=Macadamia integrifolia TaxID=60698 RepID=UPI001C4FE480|nr:leucine-rich repeat extensin-like protein 2 [Macadamia integrifolia]